MTACGGCCRQPVDQHVDADVDAGAHAVGGAELRHPHEHVDAQLLRPREVDPESAVLYARDRHASDVAVHDRDEDEHRRRAHQERDQPLLEVVEKLAHPTPTRCCRAPAAAVTAGSDAACGASAHASCLGSKPVSL